MKRLLLIFALLPLPLMPQTTRTAASNAESDVQATVNASSSGDTVQIPCTGTQSVTWTSTLTVTLSITVTALGATPNSGPSTFGAGTNCLTIVDNVPLGNPLFLLQPTYASSNNLTTLQNINIDPVSANTALTNPIQVPGTAGAAGFPQVRIDNIVFGNAVQWNETGNTFNSVQLILLDNVVGVVDHNTVPATSAGTGVELYAAQMSSYLGVGQYGDNSWAQPDSLGGANNMFFENNVVNLKSLVFNDCTEGGITFARSGGCRVVNRFNHVTENGAFALTGVHGTDTGGRLRSGRHTETYGNSVTCNNTSCGTAFASFRGGTGIVFGNTATLGSGGFFGAIFDSTPYRVVYSSDQWGSCGNATSGTSVNNFVVAGPFDTNDGVTYYSGTMTSGSTGTTMVDSTKSWTTNQFIPSGAPYSVWDITQNFVAEITGNTATSATVIAGIPEQSNSFFVGDSYQIRRSTVCMDQGGRGQGGYVSGIPPTPSGPLNQALDPIYEWDDTLPTSVNNFNQYSGKIIANRDYYTDGSLGSPQVQTSPTSPFTGATGVGFGTLANRPTTCTPNVGYFATDQGTWNSSGNGFGQGELFTCTATNTWTLSYTPYPYPYPVNGGGGGTACGNPTQNGPNFSGSYSSNRLPLPVGFTSPSGCPMFYTSSTDGSTPPAPTSGSTPYPSGGFTLTAPGKTYTYRVIACQTGFTCSSVIGGAWIIIAAPTNISIIVLGE